MDCFSSLSSISYQVLASLTYIYFIISIKYYCVMSMPLDLDIYRRQKYSIIIISQCFHDNTEADCFIRCQLLIAYSLLHITPSYQHYTYITSPKKLCTENKKVSLSLFFQRILNERLKAHVTKCKVIYNVFCFLTSNQISEINHTFHGPSINFIP